jgi:hypothetical protein
MSWLSEAHTEWHTVNGRYEVCPLDCGVAEGMYDEPTEEEFLAEFYGYSQWEGGMMPV